MHWFIYIRTLFILGSNLFGLKEIGLIQTEFSIRIKRIFPTLDSFGLILSENLVSINLSSDWFGLIWIKNLVSDWFRSIRINLSELIGLSRIDFLPFFIKRDTKHFSDWFGMICIGSDTDIGINRNSSDWLGMNFNLILSSRFPRDDF